MYLKAIVGERIHRLQQTNWGTLLPWSDSVLVREWLSKSYEFNFCCNCAFCPIKFCIWFSAMTVQVIKKIFFRDITKLSKSLGWSFSFCTNFKTIRKSIPAKGLVVVITVITARFLGIGCSRHFTTINTGNDLIKWDLLHAMGYYYLISTLYSSTKIWPNQSPFGVSISQDHMWNQYLYQSRP